MPIIMSNSPEGQVFVNDIALAGGKQLLNMELTPEEQIEFDQLKRSLARCPHIMGELGEQLDLSFDSARLPVIADIKLDEAMKNKFIDKLARIIFKKVFSEQQILSYIDFIRSKKIPDVIKKECSNAYLPGIIAVLYSSPFLFWALKDPNFTINDLVPVFETLGNTVLTAPIIHALYEKKILSVNHILRYAYSYHFDAQSYRYIEQILISLYERGLITDKKHVDRIFKIFKSSDYIVSLSNKQLIHDILTSKKIYNLLEAKKLSLDNLLSFLSDNRFITDRLQDLLSLTKTKLVAVLLVSEGEYNWLFDLLPRDRAFLVLVNHEVMHQYLHENKIKLIEVKDILHSSLYDYFYRNALNFLSLKCVQELHQANQLDIKYLMYLAKIFILNADGFTADHLSYLLQVNNIAAVARFFYNLDHERKDVSSDPEQSRKMLRQQSHIKKIIVGTLNDFNIQSALFNKRLTMDQVMDSIINNNRPDLNLNNEYIWQGLQNSSAIHLTFLKAINIPQHISDWLLRIPLLGEAFAKGEIDLDEIAQLSRAQLYLINDPLIQGKIINGEQDIRNLLGLPKQISSSKPRPTTIARMWLLHCENEQPAIDPATSSAQITACL